MKHELKGKRFGRLLVLEEAGRSSRRSVLWRVRCDCSSTYVVDGWTLTSGQSNSCGCLHRENMRARIKHGHGRDGKPSPEYNAWRALIQRCTNPKNPAYPMYGGRGISVCTRWQNSFEDFLEDVGSRPAPHLELDRINNNHGYEPGNVQWATRAQQMRNTRRTRLLTFNGETLCLKDWAKKVGLSNGALRGRLRRGWTVEQALKTPALLF